MITFVFIVASLLISICAFIRDRRRCSMKKFTRFFGDLLRFAIPVAKLGADDFYKT